MNARTTLTKSLHTVSAVSRVATLYPSMPAVEAACAALALLGQPLFYATDPTFAACVRAVEKMRAAK